MHYCTPISGEQHGFLAMKTGNACHFPYKGNRLAPRNAQFSAERVKPAGEQGTRPHCRKPAQPAHSNSACGLAMRTIAARCARRGLFEETSNQHGSVNCLATGQLRNLVPARGAGGNQDVAELHASYRGQQTAVSNCDRDVIVVSKVAKRAGHAATSGIQVDQRCRGYPG